MSHITRYDSLPTLAAYTHARNVLTVTKRVERSRSIVIIKHKYMLMGNHKIRINLMRCLRNSTARREIRQYSLTLLLNSTPYWVGLYVRPNVRKNLKICHRKCRTFEQHSFEKVEIK